MLVGAWPDPFLTSQVVQVDRIQGIADYLANPADPMQWVWLGVIVLGVVFLILVLYLINKSQQKRIEARRRLRRMRRHKAKNEGQNQRNGILSRKPPARRSRKG